MAGSSSRQRWLAPEVIQTSAMDCGPAALKCLLEGFGVPVSYGRLREACQTDVDGTSIDTLEEIAGELSLEAEQVMLPADHLLLPEADALPALVVVRMPNGLTHFVVVWRRHGPYVQVMDPAVGRRWVRARSLLDEVYVHTLAVAREQWHAWARSEGFCEPLARRLKSCGLAQAGAARIEHAAASPDWRELAALDAATRLVESLVRSQGVRRGADAGRVLAALLDPAQRDVRGKASAIPEAYWSVLPAEPAAGGEEQVAVRGAVLVRVRGRKAPAPDTAGPPRSPELAAALREPRSHAGRHLLRALRAEGWLSPALLMGGLVVVAAGLVFEALLLRGVMNIAGDLRLVEQRLQALGYFLVFALALLLVEWRVAGGLLRLGRLLEVRLRTDFLSKIPLLNDRYFQSRPSSDMAERSHGLHELRELPWLGGQLVRTALTLVLTTAAIVWLDPASAPLAVGAALAAVGLPLAFRPQLLERDLRVRTHTGALTRFYLDALLGLVPVRAHAAERAVRREHEGLLVEWAHASLQLVRSVVVLEALVALVGFAAAGALLLAHASRGLEPAGSLLLAYWALQLPILGDDFALFVSQYPQYRNCALRAVEPLGAPSELPAASGEPVPSTSAREKGSAIAIAFEAVAVRAAGQTILEGIDLSIEAGDHVAIVGASGAGKSSLMGLLLGWHRPAAGAVLVDGKPLAAERLDRLREETAWVDPAIALWNRSLIENLLYGDAQGSRAPLDEILRASELFDVLPRLQDGLQTPLGGAGGLLSGGEGQRVRVGRAWRRGRARLVLLDEPFRGLDRTRRRTLLERARRHWSAATLLCITHDLEETRDFERVLVVDGGRVVEDGIPKALLRDEKSRYRTLWEKEQSVRDELWSRPQWRRLRLQGGELLEEEAAQRL